VGRGEEPASRTASQEQRPPAAAVKVEGAGSREVPASRTASQEQRPPAEAVKWAGEGGRSPQVERLLKSSGQLRQWSGGRGKEEGARKYIDLLHKRGSHAPVAACNRSGRGRGTAHKRTRISQTYESSAVERNLRKIVF
jgi:hypothetical protein